MGVNFKEHIRALRVHSGVKLLLNTDMTITNIAVEVGESDAKLFIQDFKKYYGMTPLKYRQKYRQNNDTEWSI